MRADIERARELRNAATDVERKLWYALRDMKRAGVHFRRQPPLGKYFPDFACHRAKVIVELDGEQHGEAKQMTHDAKRSAFLESRGYMVLRFSNAEMLEHFDRTVEYIFHVASKRLKQRAAIPPPDALRASTSPRRGR